MNTNHLKKFAQDARRKLIQQVGAKLEYVLTTDSAELREKGEQLKRLKEELSSTPKDQLIEKVAYTWFNRFMALRYMDVNDYQLLGIRVITPKEGYTVPEILDEAKRGNIPDELNVQRQKVYDLLDTRIQSSNPLNEAYRELLIASCNHLNTVFPFLFEKINDYTELLIPDDLTSEFSIVADIRHGMIKEDCLSVEIIGWLYQFYISEKKDEVFASKLKVRKEDIPAATQLFTPRWIVEYMVQNTLGKLWLQNRPNSRLREHMPYLIESASLESDDYLKINSPEEIKVLDPACGSGHILVYAFDLLSKIYEEEGYANTEIPRLIIENNLYGFEIDERAAQLSAMALMIKAREYHRRAFKKVIQPNILCFSDSEILTEDILEAIKVSGISISDELIHDLNLLHQATNYGSLINPCAKRSEIVRFLEILAHYLPNADVFQRSKIESIIESLNHLSLLAQNYHCVIANPPYMGSGNMNQQLSDFVKINYPDSRSDLMACFMEVGLNKLASEGFLGVINQHSWMFISSYESLRIKIIDNVFIDTLLHLGTRTFPEIGGEVVQNSAFTILKKQFNGKSIFIRLIDFESTENKRQKVLEAIHNTETNFYYSAYQTEFKKIPNFLIGYWLNEKSIRLFETLNKIGYYFPVKSGMSTTDNPRFLRFWHEVASKNIAFDCISLNESNNRSEKWYPIRKGGEFKRWIGDNAHVLNWQFNGNEIKEAVVNNPNDPNTTHWSRRIFGTDYFFHSCITWSKISSSLFSARLAPQGTIYTDASNGAFPNENDIIPVLGFFNSTVFQFFIELISPTLNYKSGDISRVPFHPDILKIERRQIEDSLQIVQNDGEQSETEYHFQDLSLIESNVEHYIEEQLDYYIQYWEKKFLQLHKNEEEINNECIKIYDLQDVVSPVVNLESISLLEGELDKSELQKLNNFLVRNPETKLVQNYNEITLPFLSKEILLKLISYSVGCIFGRFSLDKEGIILANREQKYQDFFIEISKSKFECKFLPDEDGIVPFLEDEWFEDDIVSRFNQFLKVTFGEKNFNKNLSFIEELIGKSIRKYFIKDFYYDHIKRYKKRPLYWMFSSPNGSFNAMIYLHRYTPDTISKILNEYLKEFIAKLNNRKEHLDTVQVNGSTSEISKAIKERDRINKILMELHEYERDILYPLAIERIDIDLDDGVLVNYNKFGKALKEVKGLNDSKTKSKIMEFDWVDTSQIH